MRNFVVVAFLLLLGGCAFSDDVQAINVDYNSAIEGITNELTLLNIVRAKDGLPLHYTSVQRLTGSLTLKATGGVNAQIKDAAPTDLNSLTNAAAAAGTTITSVASRSLLSGGNIYTPSIGAEVNTGPSFDVNILDSQFFYQGILAGIPFPTINNFLLQGYGSRSLISLLAERIDFRLKNETSGVSKAKGALLWSIVNDGSNASGAALDRLLSCYTLNGAKPKSPGTPIAPLSRVTSTEKKHALSLQDLVLLDGSKLDLSGEVPENPAADRTVTVTRPTARQDAAQLVRSPDCRDPEKTVNGKRVALPPKPPGDELYAGSGQVMVLADDQRTGILVDADITVTFRSTEGLFQFIGRCLDLVRDQEPMLCRSGERTLFALHKGSGPGALVSTRLRGTSYHVANDAYARSTMGVIALLERLINLQKSSTDRPVTVPVQVVP